MDMFARNEIFGRFYWYFVYMYIYIYISTFRSAYHYISALLRTMAHWRISFEVAHKYVSTQWKKEYTYRFPGVGVSAWKGQRLLLLSLSSRLCLWL